MSEEQGMDWDNGVYAEGTRDRAFQKHYQKRREINKKYESVLRQTGRLDYRPYEVEVKAETKRFKEELKELEGQGK